MRLWSIHPKYLDRTGLTALWRESLLAQKVLKGKTKGYRNHPQLYRFKNHPNPSGAISSYLTGIWEESKKRGYSFDRGKIEDAASTEKIPVTRGQLKFEFGLLCDKLKIRDARKYRELLAVREIECHPSFEVTEGGIEEWEKTQKHLLNEVTKNYYERQRHS